VLGPKNINILGFVSGVMGIFVCAVLTYYGAKVTWDHFERGVYNPTLMEFPKGPLLIIIPVGTFLLLIQFIRKTLAILADLRAR
jgi:TRAP-type mannitol/chloroaromatic compound transport system permease small subunit